MVELLHLQLVQLQVILPVVVEAQQQLHKQLLQVTLAETVQQQVLQDHQ
jgi:hypothetical protein